MPSRRRLANLFFFILDSGDKSTMRRAFFSNSGDFEFTLVFSTEADTHDLTGRHFSETLSHSAN